MIKLVKNDNFFFFLYPLSLVYPHKYNVLNALGRISIRITCVNFLQNNISKCIKIYKTNRLNFTATFIFADDTALFYRLSMDPVMATGHLQIPS